jgi:hypothetical protein
MLRTAELCALMRGSMHVSGAPIAGKPGGPLDDTTMRLDTAASRGDAATLLMPSHKKFNDKTCVYCATQPATTEDHVFARGFFVETRRDKLPKVPACQPCNQVKSGLEHYLATVLPFAGRHADAPASLPTPRGLLAARRRPRRALNVGYRSSVASTMDRRRLSPSMPSIHTCCDTPAASGSQRWPGHPLVAALSRSQEYPASPDRFKDFWR